MIPDALSHRPDFLNSMRLKREKEEEYILYMLEFLTDQNLPEGIIQTVKERIVGEVSSFTMKDEMLYRKIREEIIASYIEFVFRGDLMEKIHYQFGHLTFQSLKNVMESRT